MGNINEILNQLTKLNENLSNLASENGGIVIHDTFASVSTWVNLGATIVATVIGGYITIILFKKQEKMRIKQELRLEFYKGYKPLYKLYIDEITSLKSTLNTAIWLAESTESAFELTESEWGPSIKLEHCKHKKTLDKIIELVKNSTQCIDKMNDYIELNKINLNEYDGELFDKLGINLFLIQNKICELEKYHREINIVHNRRYTMEELRAEYDEVVKYTIGSLESIEKIIGDSKKTHSKLEFEFLNQYFKKKWYKRIMDK